MVNPICFNFVKFNSFAMIEFCKPKLYNWACRYLWHILKKFSIRKSQKILKLNSRTLYFTNQFQCHTFLTGCLSDPILRKCVCHISYLRLDDDGKSFRPMISVDCSYTSLRSFGNRLTQLPPFLPMNTTILYVAHNMVSLICNKS